MDPFYVSIVDRINRIFRINFPLFPPEKEEQKIPINPACHGEALADAGTQVVYRLRRLVNPVKIKNL